MNILYNTFRHPGIPPVGVAQVSGDSAADARSGYDREWPAGRDYRHPGDVPIGRLPDFHGRAPDIHTSANSLFEN
ncbi:UNVERIFIED_ORG: hypothetical protein ABIB19_000911 [Arthrobacter sp. UYEF10]